MKNFIKNNWHIILLELAVIFIFALFHNKFGDIMVDSYREIYIPQQILKGQVLYKDIFAIYPPLAYLINAFLMTIFKSYKILLFTSLISSSGIIFITYKIANKFLDKNFSLGICSFLIAGFILSPNVFNSFLPYSFGILYGILFIELSIYFALKKNLTLTYLFYSIAILCKYEFILLLPFLIFWSKKENILKNILAFLIPIIFTGIVLIFQGLKLVDLESTFNIIGLMTKSKTLHWFYSVMGINFQFKLIPVYIACFLKFIIPFCAIWFVAKFHKAIKSHHLELIYAFIIIFIALALFTFNYQDILIYSFPLILAGLCFKYKSLSCNERFFIIVSILISIKVFFALTLQSYGVYFLPFALISLFILIPSNYRLKFLIALSLWTFSIAIHNANLLIKKDMTRINKVVEYVKSNTKENDKVVVYPESLAINVLAQRNSDNKFYSLIPLYVETFGENIIIKRLEIIKPEYIIINNYDTSAYYFKTFGIDYAININNWIKNHYTHIETINDFWEFEIYKSN